MSSLFPPEFQVLSDLHLETHILNPSYTTFLSSITPRARYLCLLGDIGLVIDGLLLRFLESLLQKTPNLIILFVFGNHESYGFDLHSARAQMRTFVLAMRPRYGERIVLLDRKRYDVNPRLTLLGCTLWTRVSPEQAQEVAARMTDYKRIRDWNFDRHLAEHEHDLAWLNEQVRKIGRDEPQRQIAIFTHHSPTISPLSIAPEHVSGPMSSAFSTDLSTELCWTSLQVKLWAFGHTHFNCEFYDPLSKLIFTNQKGYHGAQAEGWTLEKIIVAEGDRWIVKTIEERKASKSKDVVGRREIAERTASYAITNAKKARAPGYSEGYTHLIQGESKRSLFPWFR
ncbi:MAG: hypothetical protein M1816_004265 [Peltula sp. TS41687]|nr:MAG: hypothetical protein M1816_004265 [Peltula sp. TS41687]